MIRTARAASFLAATSLFMLQPLVARALVPLYGGTSWVWIAVSVFFQLALIVGYFSATKLTVAARARFHARLSIVAMILTMMGFWLLLRRTTLDRWPTELAVFMHLLLTVGAAAVYLAMAAPLLQIAIESDRRIDAHRLYAWSNAGSISGLVLYPTVMESFIPLRWQMALWLALAAGAAALIGRTLQHAGTPINQQPMRWRFPGRRQVLGISAVTGALTILVTTRLTLDLGALPLLWVLPLITLLLSYVVAFGDLRISRNLSATAPVALLCAVYVYFNTTVLVSPLQMVLRWCGLLFVILCGLQARVRFYAPTGGARGAYYVALAVGGFLGSLVAGCLIPYYWDRVSMLAAAPLTSPLLQPILSIDPIPEMGWCLAAAAFGLVNSERYRASDLLMAIAVVTAVVLLIALQAPELKTVVIAAAALLGAIVLAYLPTLAGRPALFPLAVTLIVLVCSYIPRDYSLQLSRTRSVYGVLTTRETADGGFTELVHGTTLHGTQASQRNATGELVPIAPRVPLTYYHKASPIGEIFKTLSATGCKLRIGIIGLGAGSLAGYANPGDEFEFYEIDPGVISAAQSPHFSFVSAARARGARVEIVEGDGRLALARRVGPKFDLIVVDAFSSDAIPTHLLTIESFEAARNQLAPGGHIAFHTSNRFFDINSVVSANAKRLGWESVAKTTGPDGLGTAGSLWVVVRPPGAADAARCPVNLFSDLAQTAAVKPVWTDDFSNPLGVLMGRGLWKQLRGTR